MFFSLHLNYGSSESTKRPAFPGRVTGSDGGNAAVLGGSLSCTVLGEVTSYPHDPDFPLPLCLVLAVCSLFGEKQEQQGLIWAKISGASGRATTMAIAACSGFPPACRH